MVFQLNEATLSECQRSTKDWRLFAIFLTLRRLQVGSLISIKSFSCSTVVVFSQIFINDSYLNIMLMVCFCICERRVICQDRTLPFSIELCLVVEGRAGLSVLVWRWRVPAHHRHHHLPPSLILRSSDVNWRR